MLTRYWSSLTDADPREELRVLLERLFFGSGSTSMSINNKLPMSSIYSGNVRCTLRRVEESLCYSVKA